MGRRDLATPACPSLALGLCVIIWSMGLRLVLLITAAVSASAFARWQNEKPVAPEQSALRYLSREVPLWYEENRCYSCHNNGDGARVLYIARRLGYETSPDSLKNTTEWLLRPWDWDENRGEPGFSDKRLARIQFAASLLEGWRAGQIPREAALREAAESLLPLQSEDGSWPIDIGEQVGSPVTWGTPLATHFALESLRAAGPDFQQAVESGTRWLLAFEPRAVIDAAAVAMALGREDSPQSKETRAACYTLIIENQKSDGGWGPLPHAPSENFDTAVAILALRSFPLDDPTRKAISRGRIYLLERQLDTAGWIETTRPSGGDSYAQFVSTTAWVTQALLESRGL